MSKFLSTSLRKLEEYTPGEQPQDKQYIKLNTNESPFPPSESVIKVVSSEEIEKLRLYCDPECRELKKELANLYNTKPENIFVSNGSDDILNFSFMAFGEKGVIFNDITYGFYSVYANLYGLDTEIVPLKDDFTVDTDRFMNKNKFIVIANPNAPTGITITLQKIEEILKSNPQNVVLIDEAYVNFGAESCSSLTEKYENLLCVQTFSKSRSMAGARLGFAIGNKELISDLEKIKYSTNPYNINRLTQVAGVAALKENDYYMANCKKIIKNREFTANELEKLGFSILPSKANFIFAKSDKISGLEFYEKLKKKGILVRHFKTPRIDSYNRITIGSFEEMQTFIEKTKEILGEIDL